MERPRALAISTLCFLLLGSLTLIGGTDNFEEQSSLQIIQQEDREEGLGRESLQCPDPTLSGHHATVRPIKGEPYHLQSEIEVTCDQGYVFPDGEQSVNVTCDPYPNPCYCVAGWTPYGNPVLQACIESLQCPDPTLSGHNTVRPIKGDPYHLQSEVEVKCDTGYVFPDGTQAVNVTCHPYPDPCYCAAGWGTSRGRDLQSCTDSLTCPDPALSAHVSVRPIKGEAPYHMSSEVEVRCDSGLVFSNGQQVVNVTCIPFPHPCMCMAGWETLTDFQIIYMDCREKSTTTVAPQSSTRNSAKRDSDDQCYNPTPVNGTLEVLKGIPFRINNVTVRLGCQPGLRFPDGTTTRTEQCLLAAYPGKVVGVWEPDIPRPLVCAGYQVDESQLATNIEDNQSIDTGKTNGDPQCPDPTPVNGTLKLERGTPYSYGCNVLLTCDAGLTFPDGLSVWNLTCLAVPYPNTVVWAPVKDGKFVCSEHADLEGRDVEETEPAHTEPADENEIENTASENLPPVEETNFDEPQCTNPTPANGTLKILSGTPYIDGCVVLLTCNPGLKFPDGLSVWNLSCVALPVLPNAVTWIPSKEDMRFVCSDEDIDNKVQSEPEEEETSYDEIKLSENDGTLHKVLDELTKDKRDVHEQEMSIHNEKEFSWEEIKMGEDEELEDIEPLEAYKDEETNPYEEPEEEANAENLENQNLEEASSETMYPEINTIDEEVNEDRSEVESENEAESEDNQEEEEEMAESEDSEEGGESEDLNEEEEEKEAEEEEEAEVIDEAEETEEESIQEVATEGELEEEVEEQEEEEQEEEQEEEEEEEEEDIEEEQEVELGEVTESIEDDIQENEKTVEEDNELEESETEDEELIPEEVDEYVQQNTSEDETEVQLTNDFDKDKYVNSFIEFLGVPKMFKDQVKEPWHVVKSDEPEVTIAEGFSDVCSLPPKTGPCKASKPRFYFDTNTRECHRFIFGGCRGNENNFESMEACNQACHLEEP